MWRITFVFRFVCGGKETFVKYYISACGSSCALAMIAAVWIDLLILMPLTSGIAASLSFTGQLGELVDVLSGLTILRECRFMIAVDLFYQLADSNSFTGLIVIWMVIFVDHSVIQNCYKETPKLIRLLLSVRLFVFRCLAQNSTLIEDITEISVSKNFNLNEL